VKANAAWKQWSRTSHPSLHTVNLNSVNTLTGKLSSAYKIISICTDSQSSQHLSPNIIETRNMHKVIIHKNNLHKNVVTPWHTERCVHILCLCPLTRATFGTRWMHQRSPENMCSVHSAAIWYWAESFWIMNTVTITISETSSSAVTKRLSDALCVSLVSFNSTIPQVQYFVLLQLQICNVM